MPDRILKINELLKEQLGRIINREIEFPLGTIVTITRVATAKDLSQARVYISILPDESIHEVMKTLIGEASHLRQLLNQLIILRTIPKLRFYLDNEVSRAQEIDKLLDNLK